ncbi:hypothetical protein LEUCIP111803_02196 [Leucobacter soli]|uniref:Uncharacterized protein n=1 Tax=Leucobacter soli TaxID=2812850 RepID=A0A916K0T5_9MICO|nr:hypothetical protein LEUCIP111803_02196 [Leucobacter soli]
MNVITDTGLLPNIALWGATIAIICTAHRGRRRR